MVVFFVCFLPLFVVARIRSSNRCIPVVFICSSSRGTWCTATAVQQQTLTVHYNNHDLLDSFSMAFSYSKCDYNIIYAAACAFSHIHTSHAQFHSRFPNSPGVRSESSTYLHIHPYMRSDQDSGYVTDNVSDVEPHVEKSKHVSNYFILTLMVWLPFAAISSYHIHTQNRSRISLFSVWRRSMCYIRGEGSSNEAMQHQIHRLFYSHSMRKLHLENHFLASHLFGIYDLHMSQCLLFDFHAFQLFIISIILSIRLCFPDHGLRRRARDFRRIVFHFLMHGCRSEQLFSDDFYVRFTGSCMKYRGVNDVPIVFNSFFCSNCFSSRRYSIHSPAVRSPMRAR